MRTIDLFSISRLRTYTDGEGVSTLVASMGCTLRCAYCLNPSSWDKSVKRHKLTAEELYNKVKRDNLYFLATGGGIVFGGGEPLIYSDFIREFIEKYKSTGWKFTLETSLSAKKENLTQLIGLIDYFIVDIKDMDKNRYELYTQGSYDLFLKNLEYLAGNADVEKITLRVPRIPRLHSSNEAEENYRILKNMGFKNIEIFDYVYPEAIKELSETALENKNKFLKSLKACYVSSELEMMSVS